MRPRLTFAPVAVQDCGGRGVCVPPAGECVCFAGYAGYNCGVCEAGFVVSPAAPLPAPTPDGTGATDQPQSVPLGSWCVPLRFTLTDTSPVDVSQIPPFPPAPPPPLPPPPPPPLPAGPPAAGAASRAVPADLAPGALLVSARTAGGDPGGSADDEATEAQRAWQAQRTRRIGEVAVVAAGAPLAAAAATGVLGAAWWGVRRGCLGSP